MTLPDRGFWLRVLGVFGIATLLGVFFSSQLYIAYLYREGTASFRSSALWVMPYWYAWVPLVPVVLWLSRKLVLEKGRLLRNIPLHLIAGVAVSFAHLYLLQWITTSVDWLIDREFNIRNVHSNLLTYWAIVGAHMAVGYHRRFKQRELLASKLETQLVESKLQILKMQLQPHFLFNTLHTISSLMHRDVEAADSMMTRLGDLLRMALDSEASEHVSLKREIEFLDGYLEIEKTRFQDRLTIDKRIDPETLDAQVPNMFLQPLVENAIRHGIEPRSAAGCVRIECTRVDGKLRIQIADDGTGLPDGDRIEEGIGIANTRARLGQLYNGGFRFDIANGSGRGATVTIEIPFETKGGA